jgi:hypothetical protein
MAIATSSQFVGWAERKQNLTDRSRSRFKTESAALVSRMIESTWGKDEIRTKVITSVKFCKVDRN